MEGKMGKQEKVVFTSADGETLAFYIVEQTKINNINYILATDVDDEEMAYILKETFSDSENGFAENGLAKSGLTKEESVFEFVEDDNELEAISKVFGELLEDTDIETI